MRIKELKQGLFTTGHNSADGVETVDRYIIENAEDVEKYFKYFPNFVFLLKSKFHQYVAKGDVLIATDRNTWCIASNGQPSEKSHPASFYHVK